MDLEQRFYHIIQLQHNERENSELCSLEPQSWVSNLKS